MLIPNELKKLPNWIAWKSVPSDDGKKPRKVPLDIRDGSFGSSQNPDTWGTYEQAATLNRDGVGFVPRTPYFAIDLDHCVSDGKINDFAKRIISLCNSYTEFSPSKTGVHILMKGDLPYSVRTTEIEFYQNSNFITVTGNIVSPYRPIRNASPELLEKILPKRTVKEVVNLDESWILPALNSIEPGEGQNGRTPVFVRVIASLKARRMKSDEVEAFLQPWVEKYNYGTDRIQALIADQYQRYPVSATTEVSDDIENFLSQIETVDWLVPGLMAKQSIGFFCGLPETCKTWALIDLAIEAARGGQWLGRFPVKLSKVLFINQERSKAETQRRFKSLIKAKGLSLKEIKENLLIKSGTTIRVDLQHSFDAFRKDISEKRPELIIVDSWSTFHTKEEQSNTDNMFVLERIKALREEFCCTFVFVDHESKKAYQRSVEGKEPTMGDQSGASAKSRVAELMLAFVSSGPRQSMVHHTKSTQGTKIAPFLVEVVDLPNEGIEVVAR